MALVLVGARKWPTCHATCQVEIALEVATEAAVDFCCAGSTQHGVVKNLCFLTEDSEIDEWDSGNEEDVPDEGIRIWARKSKRKSG